MQVIDTSADGLFIMSAPAPLPIDYSLTLADYQAGIKHLSPPSLTWTPKLSTLLVMVGFFLILYLPGVFEHAAPLISGAAIGCVAMIYFFVAFFRRHQQRCMPHDDGVLLCYHRVEVHDDSLHVRAPTWESRYLWQAFHTIEETPTHYFLRIDKFGSYIIPKRAFAEPTQAKLFLEFIQAKLQQPRVNTAG